MTPELIARAVQEYVMQEFLPGESPDVLTPSTPLVSGGVLDSIATVKLVAFLEERYGVRFEAHEMGPEYMDTVTAIAALVSEKLARQ